MINIHSIREIQPIQEIPVQTPVEEIKTDYTNACHVISFGNTVLVFEDYFEAKATIEKFFNAIGEAA